MESLNLKRFSDIPLPKFVKVKQLFKQDRIDDVVQEVRAQLIPHLTHLQGKTIAIGVGSRGIANIKVITKTLVNELITAGAKPFIIPTMGSHGGATALGQAGVLATYGITPDSMGVPVDASLEVVSIGELEPGLPIYVAQSALQAEGIIVIARVKAHTAFRGPIESGVAKMITIGLGKQIGADSLHHQGFGRFAELIPKAAQMIVEKSKVLFALGIVENAYEQTYKIEVISRPEILAMDKERALLEESKKIMGQLLFPEFDVLVIEEIGKNISGDGQDPNVTGLYINKYCSGGPRFQKSVIFGLTEETHGNANGMGVVDVVARNLFDDIDFGSTYTNSFTSTEILPVKIPMVAGSKEDALRIVVKTCNGVERGKHRIVWIKNTLELEEIVISEALLEEAQAHSQIEVLTQPGELTFNQGEPIFPW
ncbi:MAG: iron-sulfur cluster binding protein [Peptococcaceae bacterium BRH_c23]|nr:MAG: iron-sulfur cluster binding protein [Peptococcaceae bacterium BRH_c23]KJS90171.1 MAG: iron-sulfur cluster binding protein [Desulfosporosinus sp. BICA1-9]HBW38945.1 iron-sulfur cluster binding protein [Desulfosporosinus sp.]